MPAALSPTSTKDDISYDIAILRTVQLERGASQHQARTAPSSPLHGAWTSTHFRTCALASFGQNEPRLRSRSTVSSTARPRGCPWKDPEPLYTRRQNPGRSSTWHRVITRERLFKVSGMHVAVIPQRIR